MDTIEALVRRVETDAAATRDDLGEESTRGRSGEAAGWLRWPAKPRSHVVRSASMQQQAHLRMLFRGVPVHDPRVPALRILMAVLGDQSGRLFAALREDEGLVYSVGAKSVEALEGGYLAIAASTRHDRVAKVRRKIRQVLLDLREEGIRPEELQRATRTLVSEHERGRQRRMRLSIELAMRAVSDRPWAEFGQFPRSLRTVTRQDVQEVAQALLDPSSTVEVRSRNPKGGA
jgi:zinc protease